MIYWVVHGLDWKKRYAGLHFLWTPLSSKWRSFGGGVHKMADRRLETWDRVFFFILSFRFSCLGRKNLGLHRPTISGFHLVFAVSVNFWGITGFHYLVLLLRWCPAPGRSYSTESSHEFELTSLKSYWVWLCIRVECGFWRVKGSLCRRTSATQGRNFYFVEKKNE